MEDDKYINFIIIHMYFLTIISMEENYDLNYFQIILLKVKFDFLFS